MASPATACSRATGGLLRFFRACYTPGASRGCFPRSITGVGVLNSLATGRRLAFRIVWVQLLVAVLVALAFWLQDARAAIAAAMGGGAVVLGSALLALRSFTTVPRPAGLALQGMLVGAALKWVVVVAAFYIALVRFSLPPVPLLAGMIITTFAFGFAARLKT